jgi:hypothetical protein
MKTMTKWLIGFMLVASSVMANDIYIQQSGDNLDLDITQDGQNNQAGNSTTAMSLTGNNMTFSISQVGNSNVIEALINGTSYTGNINLTGGLNTVDLDCATTNCDTVSMSIDVTGDSADVTVNLGSTADASDYVGTIDITSAASETFTLTVNAAAADADIDISNATGLTGNTSSYTQTGDGDSAGHSLTHSHTGDGGVINMSQSGIYDNKINVTTSGDNAAIDITQSD